MSGETRYRLLSVRYTHTPTIDIKKYSRKGRVLTLFSLYKYTIYSTHTLSLPSYALSCRLMPCLVVSYACCLSASSSAAFSYTAACFINTIILLSVGTTMNTPGIVFSKYFSTERFFAF